MTDAEFSRIIKLDDIGRDGLSRIVTADEPERAALAERFALAGLALLDAAFSLRWRRLKGRADEVLITGTLRAKGDQICVATLRPAPFQLEAPVDERFTTAPAEDVMEDADLTADDAPEPIEGDLIDLGELAAQILAVSLAPYPRAPDAPDDASRAEDLDDAVVSPFAALKDRLKD